MGAYFLPDPGFWLQTTFLTSSSSVPFSASWVSQAFLFVLVYRTHLMLLFFFGLYLSRFTLLPGCSSLFSFFLPNLSLLCSLILTPSMSSFSSLIRLWLHVLSVILSVYFTPCLCLLKQETSCCRIKITGHWLEFLLTI